MSLRHRPWEEGWDFSIGLRPIAEADWLEGGEADPSARKDALLAAHPQIVWGEAPGSQSGQKEVAELVDAALGSAPPDARHPALYAASRRVADDLVLMEKRDGAWAVAALSLSAPTFFTANEVLGKSLAELHGPVHGFADRFLARVARIFDGLRAGLILERRNWTLVNSGETFTPHAEPVRARIPDIAQLVAGRELFIRVERQTLRRLPATGGALFTIRVWLAPLDAVAETPERLAAFAGAWRSATADFRAYKGFAQYESLVDGFLRSHGESHSVNAT
jgi:hypothetical protein